MTKTKMYLRHWGRQRREAEPAHVFTVGVVALGSWDCWHTLNLSKDTHLHNLNCKSYVCFFTKIKYLIPQVVMWGWVEYPQTFYEIETPSVLLYLLLELWFILYVNITWLELTQLCRNVVIKEAVKDRVDAGGGESDKVTDEKVQQVTVSCEVWIIMNLK